MMNDIEFLDLVMRYQDGAIGPEELARFEHELASNPARRRLFTETALQAATLMERFRSEPLPVRGINHGEKLFKPGKSRPVLAGAMMMIGIIMGLAGGGFVWAMSVSRVVVTSKPVAGLVDGGFEGMTGVMPWGFPDRVGIWSGDGAEIVVEGALEGMRRARFLKAEADANAPQGRAIACDLFQMVDLRGIPFPEGAHGDSVLELSASFVDERPENTKPSVTFFCQIYLFQGDPASVQKTWPINIAEAVATGSAETTTLGSGLWRRVTAKSLVPASAGCAVIHIAARPNIRGPMPAGLFVDDVRLRLNTPPAIPMRILER